MIGCSETKSQKNRIRFICDQTLVGKINLEAMGKLQGPESQWNKTELRRVQLQNAKKLAEGMLEHVNGELDKLS